MAATGNWIFVNSSRLLTPDLYSMICIHTVVLFPLPSFYAFSSLTQSSYSFRSFLIPPLLLSFHISFISVLPPSFPPFLVPALPPFHIPPFTSFLLALHQFFVPRFLPPSFFSLSSFPSPTIPPFLSFLFPAFILSLALPSLSRLTVTELLSNPLYPCACVGSLQAS